MEKEEERKKNRASLVTIEWLRLQRRHNKTMTKIKKNRIVHLKTAVVEGEMSYAVTQNINTHCTILQIFNSYKVTQTTEPVSSIFFCTAILSLDYIHNQRLRLRIHCFLELS